MSYQPKFKVNNDIISLVADVAELIGQVKVSTDINKSPKLRRANRIKTIHSSLAIEQNTLSLEQVTSVLNGKAVLAPPKDIEEVKNAYEIYELLDTLNPYSVNDLLKSHSVLMKGLVEEAGVFRSKSVGVFDSHTNEVIHLGTLPAYAPEATENLLKWLEKDKTHILIKSCVFHYEFEVLHPFLDGNGRIGRLWQTLVLSKYNPIFAYLPVESMIYKKQQEYYDCINYCNSVDDCTAFVEFMLKAIKETLTEASCSINENSEQDMEQDNIKKLLEFCKQPRTRAEMQKHIGIAGRKLFNSHYLQPLLNSNKLVMTIPNKPSSKNQKYVVKNEKRPTF